MISDAVLKVSNLIVKHSKDAEPILSGVDINCSAGEILLIAGENATGKTTLLKSLMGLIPFTTGSILYCGTEIKNLSTRLRVQRGISLVSQGGEVFRDLTTIENIEFAALQKDKSRTQTLKKVKEVLDSYPALRRSHKIKGGQLSGGERQQLAIAMAVVQSPQLLLMDEPSIGIASQMLGFICNQLVCLKKQGVSIILSEQNEDWIVGYADYRFELVNGKLV